MGFLSPKTPQPVAPQPVPTINQATQQADQNDQLRRRMGFASTILVPQGQNTNMPSGLGMPQGMAMGGFAKTLGGAS